MDLLRPRRTSGRCGSGRGWRGSLGTGALTAFLLVPHAARAQFVDPTFPVTDGYVHALTLSGDTLFAAGQIQYLGPNTGGLGIVDAVSGARESGWPRVDGAVRAIAPDGAGGWFIGGTFLRVAGVSRPRLAHVRADGSLDAWNPSPDGDVAKLALGGSTLYVCGAFTVIGGQVRPRLAGLDVRTGVATPWSPAPNASVIELALSGPRLYVGGTFGIIGGQARACIAAFDTSGALTPWNPVANGYVSVIVPHGGTLWLGGEFTSIGGSFLPGCAAVDSVTGLPRSWTPNPFPGGVFAIAVEGARVYLGGIISGYVSGLRHIHNLEAVDAVSGAALDWVPGTDSLFWSSYDYVNHIEVHGSTVIVAGSFSEIGSRRRLNVAALDATTGLATQWNPGTNGNAVTVAIAGDRVALGGDFNSTGGSKPDGGAAIDLRTGGALQWNPDAIGGLSYSVACNASTVYLGGQTSVAGQWHPALAAVDLTTARSLGWNPLQGGVSGLAASDSAVYAGGDFVTLADQRSSYLAAFDPASGEPQAWDPFADGRVDCLARTDSTLIAGGEFTHAGGQARARLAALDPKTAAATAWDPGADGPVLAVSPHGSLVYAGGRFSNIGGQPRSRLAALDAVTGLATSWNPSASDAVVALAANGGTVYAGGFFSAIGGKPRRYFAVLDAASGHATAWDPAADYTVQAIVANGSDAYAGGGFNLLGGRTVHGLARIVPLPDSPPHVRVVAPNGGEHLVNHAANFVTWDAGAPRPGVESVDVYLSRTGPAGPWQLMAAGVANTGGYLLALEEAAPTDQYSLRIDARDYAGTLTSDVSDGVFSIGEGTLGVGAIARGLPARLERVAPDPVQTEARIEFTLGGSAHVELSIVDLQGRLVRTLLAGEATAGRHTAGLDARSLAMGVYFLRLRGAGVEQSRRMIVLH